MPAASERDIVHVEIAGFAVAVERLVHPELKKRPVAVGLPGAPRSVITAVSPEAWQAGVRAGMVVARALRCCRELAIVPPNEELYRRAARAIGDIVRRYTPVLEPAGYGHVFLDISGTGRLFGSPRDTAWRLRNEIRAELRLDASLGVAGNKMVSRIASFAGRRSGLEDVRHGAERGFIAPFPASVLPGVVAALRQRLQELNLQFVRDIANTEPRHLALAFGRLGFTLHQRSLGLDHSPVRPPGTAPSVECEETLGEETNDYDELRVAVSRLSGEASDRLNEESWRGRTLELLVVYADQREGTAQTRLSVPASSEAVIRTDSLRLLDRALRRRTRVRRLRLRVLDLIRGSVQLELFPDPQPERRIRLEAAVDRLQQRYGPAAVRVSTELAVGGGCAPVQARGAGKPRVQEHAERAPEPWV